MYAPYIRLSPSVSHLLVSVIGGYFLVLWILALVAWAAVEFMRARGMRSVVADPRLLRPGAALLAGTVTPEAGEEGAPVVLTVHQEGERLVVKERAQMLWTEVRRELKARPFYLTLDGGRKVRVEPGEHIDLVDHLEAPKLHPTSPMTLRTREARLDPGERVYVHGSLERGIDPTHEPRSYRQAPAPTLVLRPLEGWMHFTSGPLHERFHQRALYHLAWAFFGALVFVGAHGLFFADYHALRRRGVVVEATVIAHRAELVPSGKRRRMAYIVEASLPTGEVLTDEIAQNMFDAAYNAPSVPFTMDPRNHRNAQIGAREVGVTRESATLYSLLLAVLAGGHLAVYRFRRPWYERDRVIDREPLPG